MLASESHNPSGQRWCILCGFRVFINASPTVFFLRNLLLLFITTTFPVINHVKPFLYLTTHSIKTDRKIEVQGCIGCDRPQGTAALFAMSTGQQMLDVLLSRLGHYHGPLNQYRSYRGVQNPNVALIQCMLAVRVGDS
jgi:hypothetical protein